MTTSLHGIVPGIIDAHIHQWDPLSTPRRASGLAKLFQRARPVGNFVFNRIMPASAREAIIVPDHVFFPYLPSDYATDTALAVDALGVPVEATIHVEADWHSEDPAEETAWLDTLPWGQDGRPALAAILGHADPTAPGFAELLDAHAAASPRFRGIRQVAVSHPDKGVQGDHAPGLLGSASFLRGFSALAERGLTFDAYLYSHQLPDLVTLAREYPDTTMVVDHYAPPVGVLGPRGKASGHTAGDREAILTRWRDQISEVATCPNVVAKHSGLGFPMLGHPQRQLDRRAFAEQVRPLVEHVTQAFGEDRLVFGSNFPMDKAVVDFGTLVGALADLLAPQGEALLRKVFRENAQRVYSLS